MTTQTPTAILKRDSDPVFSQIFDSDERPREKRRILPESTPAPRVRGHL